MKWNYILHAAFLLWKLHPKLFCTYTFGLYFFGAKILAQRPRVKCWWNWLQESRSFGSALSQIGMSKGDVLAILMPNCPEYLLALLGTTGREIFQTYVQMCGHGQGSRAISEVGFKKHFKGVGRSTELKHFIKLWKSNSYPKSSLKFLEKNYRKYQNSTMWSFYPFLKKLPKICEGKF